MVNIIVTVTDAALDRLDEVVEKLRHAGMDVEEILELLGQVLGRADSQAIAVIQAIPEVADVQVSQPFQLPPPDEPIQ